MAFCNDRSYLIEHMDVDGAYLNADLKEDIVMKVLSPMNEWIGSQSVKLKKALYGLKQAGHEWNACLTEHLMKIGYIQVVFHRTLEDGKKVFVLIYMDDIILIAHEYDERLQRSPNNVLFRIVFAITLIQSSRYSFF